MDYRFFPIKFKTIDLIFPSRGRLGQMPSECHCEPRFFGAKQSHTIGDCFVALTSGLLAMTQMAVSPSFDSVGGGKGEGRRNNSRLKISPLPNPPMSADRQARSGGGKFWGIILSIVFFLPTGRAEAKPFETVKFLRELKEGLTKPVDVAVSATGDVYVLDHESAKVFVFNPEGKLQVEIGQKGTQVGEFNNPRSLAVAPDGQIFVSDTGNNRIQVLDKSGQWLFSIGGAGSAPGLFNSPSGIAVDHFGLLFVADRKNHRIQFFSPHGVFLGFFETEDEPVDIAVDPQWNLYVLIPILGKIVKYSPYGKKITEISCTVQNDNYVAKAEGLTVDVKGDIYLAESVDNSVKKINGNAELQVAFGSQGGANGQFQNPGGVAVDPYGQVYVADTQNGRVQIFRVSGEEKTSLPFTKNSPLILDFYTTISAQDGARDLEFLAGNFYLLFDSENTVWVKGRQEIQFGKKGVHPGELTFPKAICATLDGNIYMADTGNDRVQVFYPDGTLNFEFGRAGWKPGEFRNPQVIAVNSKGVIYVADTNNNRIQMFTHEGIFLNAFGEEIASGSISPGGELRYPQALTIDSADRVYVVDSEGKRIVVFDVDGKYLVQGGEHGRLFGGDFVKLVDIALDENDNLYIADQGNYTIKVVDPYGKLLLAFGAPGKEGRGYFQDISAIAAAEGKIYVADYKSDQVQVFRFSGKETNTQDRVYTSKVVPASDDKEENSVLRYTLAKKTAIQQGVQELNQDIKLSPKELDKYLKIEAVETTTNKQVKVTVSLPRSVLREKSLSDGKKGGKKK